MEPTAVPGFLYGVDFSFNGDICPHVVAQYPPLYPGPIPPLASVLRNIPVQRADSIRVLVEHFPDGGTLVNLFQPPSYNSLISNHTSTSVAEIIAQCQGGDENGTAWGFGMTSFDHSTANTHLGPDLTTKSWLPRARFFKDTYGNVILFVSCKLSVKTMWREEQAEGSRYCHDILLEFMHTMENMDRQYKAITQGIPRLRAENQSMLLVLRMLHSQILMQCRTLDTFRDLYDFHLAEIASHMQATVGAAVVTTQFLEKIAIISHHADQVHAENKSVVDLVDALLDMLSPLFHGSAKFKRFDTELRAISRNLVSRTEDLVPRMESKLKFLEINRNIRESTSLWLLSLFAAIFLPFSLASSLLSMQTRLTDLHLILYDFCGVIVFFGSLALVIVSAMKQFAKRKGNVHGIIQINKGANLFVVLLGWAAMVVSFLVGMIVDVGLGLKILYFGAASTVGVILLFSLLRFVYMHSSILKGLVKKSREAFLLGWKN
ncbi:hypothetical protein BU23DRAFT_295348 [Bimuria novae-zelandiae CBS 107.79]|uniref:Uncharacterized protein n=1 Tax=Bimuria novae-zelandiae CBS 107.79 TaxID=1447943 RepID=A0A6A5VID2_9PLEO|nr:hypothetical protein BU23DRAFT_295348 [Bimuria novae-zelandiae CBS 107.79]